MERGKNYILDLYLWDIRRYKLLTAKEEKILIKKVKSGDQEAKEKFIISNLLLVISIAKNYIGWGLDFLDLIQEGNLGLMKALEKFDPLKTEKFSTYAYKRIDRSIKKTILNQGKNVRWSTRTRDIINKLNNFRDKCFLESAKFPSIELEKDFIKSFGVSDDLVALILTQDLLEESLDKTIIGQDSEKTTLEELIEDPNSISLAEEKIKEIGNFGELRKDFEDALDAFLENCDLKDQLIFKAKLGLDGGALKTYDEISRFLLNDYGIGVKSKKKKALSSRSLGQAMQRLEDRFHGFIDARDYSHVWPYYLALKKEAKYEIKKRPYE